MIEVLYDGWELVYHPNSPAALHLFELLEQPLQDVRAIVALPAELQNLTLPVETIFQPYRNTPTEHLRWEQLFLPALTRKIGASLLHLVSYSAALFGAPPTVISPCGFERRSDSRPKTWSGRLRKALSFGTAEQARALLWPEDLPTPHENPGVYSLPPLVSPDFNSVEPADPDWSREFSLPETYILVDGAVFQSDFENLLAVWSWAAGSIGDLYPLVVFGLGASEHNLLVNFAQRYQMERTIHALPAIPLKSFPSLFRGCSALLQIGEPTVWGNFLRHALACGKPVVATSSPATEAVVGEAAYLAPASDLRALGAALLTVIVEEQVSGSLVQAALERVATWQLNAFANRLEEFYRRIS